MAIVITDVRVLKGKYTSLTIYRDGRVVYRFGGDPAGRAVNIDEETARRIIEESREEDRK